MAKLEFVITERELVHAPYHPGGPHQLILSLLKEAGAPIKGGVWLSIDDRYYLDAVENAMGMSVTYTFKPKK